MNKYLLAISAVALLGMSQLEAAWWNAKSTTTTTTGTTKKVSGFGRHRMTRAEKISRGEERVAGQQAIVNELQRSGFAKNNPAAFALATKSLSRSEHYLKNVKSGKSTRHRRHHRRPGMTKRSTTTRTVAKA